MTVWVIIDSHFHPTGLGYLTDFLLESDPRPIRDQLNERYAHGGGYSPIEGITFNPSTGILTYPGDPPIHPSAMAQFNSETVIFYQTCELLTIIQSDGTWEVTRVN